MGRSTYSAAVPYKLESITGADNWNQPTSDWERALCGDCSNLSEVPNTFGPNGSHDPNCMNGIDFGNGWVYYDGACVDYVNHNSRVICDELINHQKGLSIYVINEAEYDTIYDISLFAEDEAPLQAFLSDMGVQHPILKTASVHQTL